EWPTWLQGILLRNGPGMHTIGDTKYNHWFDGLALLHSFTFKNGEVYYRSKYLRSDAYNCNVEANRIVVSEFGTMAYPDPCKNIFAKAFCYLSHTIPEFTDNCLINIMKTGDDFYATSETNFIRKINPQTLETLEKSKREIVEIIDFLRIYEFTSTLCCSKYKSQAEKEKKKSCFKHLEVVCSIPSRSLLHPSYYHSFGITENYIIFVEQPFRLDIVKMATAYIRGVNWASCLAYHKEEKTWFHFIDKKTKKEIPTKIYTDAMVLFHHVNAYEEDGHIVFDIIAYADNSLYDMFYLKNLNKDFEENTKLTSVPTCKRFVVPLQYDKDAEVGSNLVTLPSTATAIKEKDGSIYCQPEILCEGIELPRINYDYNGKKYRYVFATGVQWSPVPTKIVKFNVQTKETLHWTEDHCWPSEPIFVPRPDAKEEDDGVVLTCIVMSDPNKAPFLLALDAKTFKELGRATVNVEMHLDLHGIFIPEKDMKTEPE
ncbi:PREDICTED: beta,beta-carotene 15,15'-monooxygenase, partial [Tinamus guttatus]|uniref:beta,beta-carotene 15,15'-monooxygenase n=1 Tax=Tinamus guttatus TaxID=94827 RepID=UPI00052EAC3B